MQTNSTGRNITNLFQGWLNWFSVNCIVYQIQYFMVDQRVFQKSEVLPGCIKILKGHSSAIEIRNEACLKPVKASVFNGLTS